MNETNKEYELIKQEILIKVNKIDNFNALFYTTVAAIYTFAFTQNEALVFLVPVIVIIPIYIMRMKEISSMLRMGAYLLVFLEGKEFMWETRLVQYDKKFKHNKPSIDLYIFVSIVSFLLCLRNLDYFNMNLIQILIKISLAIIFLVACLFVIVRYKVDYKKEKERYINEWEEIRRNEVLNKKENVYFFTK